VHVVALAQPDQEVGDVAFLYRGEVVDAPAREELGVAAQVSLVGLERVGREPTFDPRWSR
jgi:hypothetical protein